MGAHVIEAMLLRWGESPTGRTVTFLLPEDQGQHPFKGLPTGPAHGQRLALSVALIADDETAHSHVPSQAPQEPADGANAKGGPLARQAGILCQDARFRAFINEYYTEISDGGPIEAVRILCDVRSRAELDHNPTAAAKWRALHAEYIAETA